MEGLARLVSESMARNGMDCSLDYRRLHWSRWFRCETSFDLLLLPAKPGLFALAEELLPPGETAASSGKRMLAILDVSQTEDLSISISRLFAPNHPLRDRFAGSRIFARYTVIEDDAQRSSAQSIFQRWLAASAETATGILNDFAGVAYMPAPALEIESQCRLDEAPESGLTSAQVAELGRDSADETAPIHRSATVHPPAPLPSGF